MPPESQEFQQVRNYLFVSLSMFLVFVVLFESSRSLKAIYLKRRWKLYTLYIILLLLFLIYYINYIFLVQNDLKKMVEFHKYQLVIGFHGYIQY